MKSSERSERRRSLRETYNNQKRKTSGTKPYGPQSAFTASVCDQTRWGARCEPPDSRPGRSPTASLALVLGPVRPAPTTRVEGYESREVAARAPASLARRRQLRSRENQFRSHAATPPAGDRSSLLRWATLTLSIGRGSMDRGAARATAQIPSRCAPAANSSEGRGSARLRTLRAFRPSPPHPSMHPPSPPSPPSPPHPPRRRAPPSQ